MDGVLDDEVNRLCAEVGDKYHWAFANINLRPFYGDGSKSYGYEIAEQLGWKTPDHVIVPCAGGSLITKIPKAFQELEKLGLLDAPGEDEVYTAQASGCNPITSMIKTGAEVLRPQRPNTIAKSIAIGNPADGYYAADICRKTGGGANDVTDDEVIEGITLLARTEEYLDGDGGRRDGVRDEERWPSRAASIRTTPWLSPSPATASKPPKRSRTGCPWNWESPRHWPPSTLITTKALPSPPPDRTGGGVAPGIFSTALRLLFIEHDASKWKDAPAPGASFAVRRSFATP